MEKKAKEFSEVLKDFSDWMEDFDVLFSGADEAVTEHDDDKTYTVRISGLTYCEAQNIIDWGLEYAKNATIMEEM